MAKFNSGSVQPDSVNISRAHRSWSCYVCLCAICPLSAQNKVGKDKTKKEEHVKGFQTHFVLKLFLLIRFSFKIELLQITNSSFIFIYSDQSMQYHGNLVLTSFPLKVQSRRICFERIIFFSTHSFS